MSVTTHSDIIKSRAQKIANLGESNEAVVEFISQDILNLAAQKMESRLGAEAFGNYVTMFTDNAYATDTEFYLMTAAQKKLYKLENAESYYCLYFLALALKKIKKGNVLEDSSTFGTTGNARKIDPSAIDELWKLRNQYLSEAENILSSVSLPEGIIGVVI